MKRLRARSDEVWAPNRGCTISGPAFFGSAGTSDAASVYNALVAYWDFEENGSGTQFLDSFGSNHLSIYTGASAAAASSMSTATGVVGRGMQFDDLQGDSPSVKQVFIPRSNTALDLPNSNWTFGGWVRRVSGSSIQVVEMLIMGRPSTGASGAETVAMIYVDPSSNEVRGRMKDSSGTTYEIATTGAPFSGSGYTMFTMTLNRSQNRGELRWRNATADTQHYATVAFPNSLYVAANTANFCFNGNRSADTTWQAAKKFGLYRADSCFYMSKAITDSEFDYLFNAGAGKSFSQLAADAGH